jgi:hypothetical protein
MFLFYDLLLSIREYVRDLNLGLRGSFRGHPVCMAASVDIVQVRKNWNIVAAVSMQRTDVRVDICKTKYVFVQRER